MICCVFGILPKKQILYFFIIYAYETITTDHTVFFGPLSIQQILYLY